MKIMKTLGLIGFGQFGQLTARHLKTHFRLNVYDPFVTLAADTDTFITDLETTAACDIVILAVPVKALENLLETIAPFLKPGALVVDVSSVKILPAQWMKDKLPEHVDIVATHPLFGPQSAKNGLQGLTIAICPIRGTKAESVAAFCRSLELKTFITTPDEHDHEMAYVQALTHLIGRTLNRMNIPNEMLKTSSYQHLLELCELLQFDTMDLFTSIQAQNPYAAEVSQRFIQEASDLLTQAGIKAST